MSPRRSAEISAWSRRDVLAWGGTLAATACLPAKVGAAAAADGDWIDAHVHVWTPDTTKYPLAAGWTKEQMDPASFTPQTLFEHCRPHGVKRIVLIQMSYYRTDNSYMLDVMTQHPGVFGGVAIVDESKSPATAMRELKQRGVRGFRIRPFDRQPDQWLAGEGMRAMWQCGADEGLAMCHLIDPEFLPAVDAMCQRFPDTPVVVDHFARIGVDGRIRNRDLDHLCRLARHANTSVKVSAFYALGQKKAPYKDLLPMIRRVLDAFGPQRLMWASDCPFQVVGGHRYGPSIELIQQCDFLSGGDRDWILRKTAERVFFS